MTGPNVRLDKFKQLVRVQAKKIFVQCQCQCVHYSVLSVCVRWVYKWESLGEKKAYIKQEFHIQVIIIDSFIWKNKRWI